MIENIFKRTNFPKLIDACDERHKEYSKEVYNLCNLCGFQMQDLDKLIKEIDKLYESNNG